MSRAPDPGGLTITDQVRRYYDAAYSSDALQELTRRVLAELRDSRDQQEALRRYLAFGYAIGMVVGEERE